MRPIEHLYRGARLDPEAVALIFGAETIRHGALVRRVDALAAAFQNLDPSPGSRVAICAHNTPEHVIALLATLAAGKTWVALNPLNGRGELDAFIAATRPGIVVADENCVGLFDHGAARLVIGRPARASKKAPDFLAALVARHDGDRPRALVQEPTDAQAIKFTGGSTGRPKGVVQTLRVWNTVAATQAISVGFSRASAHLCASPVTHGTGTYLLPVLGAGGRLVLLERAKAADILDAFEHQAITSTFLPPTAIYNLLAEKSVATRRYPALSHLIYAGAAMRPEKISEARRVFGPVIATTFGQTEAPQIVTFQAPREFDDARNLASVGRATAFTRVAIMDGEGRILEPGGEGEIVVGGDIVMGGYLDMAEETARTIRGGWLHTGDIGVIDARGHLFIKGRMRDIVISGGFNIYPADVEAALGRHPAVRECVAFGIPDDKWGERLEAAVELHDGATADLAELAAIVREALGPIKTPKVIHVLAHLPRSAVGKVLRGEAKAMIHPDQATPAKPRN